VNQPLSGGSMSGVVREGDTVRRNAGSWTPTVHRLLEHLRGCGVPGVPKPLGVDRIGREVLEFLPGEHRQPGDEMAGVPRYLREVVGENVGGLRRSYQRAVVDGGEGHGAEPPTQLVRLLTTEQPETDITYPCEQGTYRADRDSTGDRYP
jgi:hypothetical protein